MKFIIGSMLALNISVILAGDWSCRNHDVEISCNKEKCEVSDSFTPLDTYFDDKGNMSIGMYTGVWEGKGKVIKEKDYMVVIGNDLVFSTSTDRKEDILIAFDTEDKVAVIKGVGYAMPMTCEEGAMEN